jgi:hypothetical protein
MGSGGGWGQGGWTEDVGAFLFPLVLRGNKIQAKLLQGLRKGLWKSKEQGVEEQGAYGVSCRCIAICANWQVVWSMGEGSRQLLQKGQDPTFQSKLAWPPQKRSYNCIRDVRCILHIPRRTS